MHFSVWLTYLALALYAPNGTIGPNRAARAFWPKNAPALNAEPGSQNSVRQQYRAAIVNVIGERWYVLVKAHRETLRHNTTIQADFRIERDGRISHLRFTPRAGNPLLLRLSKQALLAVQLPPLPKEFTITD